MRLSVNLEEPYYRAAKALSKAEDCSLSAAVNKLIASGFEREGERPSDSVAAQRTFPVSRGARKVTAEWVAELDQDG